MTVAVRLRAAVTGYRRRGVQEHDLALALRATRPNTSHSLTLPIPRGWAALVLR